MSDAPVVPIGEVAESSQVTRLPDRWNQLGDMFDSGH